MQHRQSDPEIRIGDRVVGPGHPTYVIAEISANHGKQLDRAVELVERAAQAGADAVKLQTYTADTMTIDCDKQVFRVREGTLWAGRTYYDLYSEAATPWEWHPVLQQAAAAARIQLFSSPFDATAVDFLADLNVPAFKIASFEIVDHELIRYAASKGRPLILSTGMASAAEIDAAIAVARDAGAVGVGLLRCNSSYPAPHAQMGLRTIPDMAQRWNVPVGLSDHTLGICAAVTAVALGACILEKHFTLDRAEPGPDSAFSIEPSEFASLVAAVRETEDTLGGVRYGPSPAEENSAQFRRSLFVVRDTQAGEPFTRENVRAIRPGAGLPPRYLGGILGCRATRDIERGTPLAWDAVEH